MAIGKDTDRQNNGNAESPIPRDARIAIVGAGSGGLSAAYYLKQHGYNNVVVLERLGRVGGLCRTITEDGLSFDLGANFVTPAYKRVRQIADEYDAELYAEVEGGVLRYCPDNDEYDQLSVWDAVRGGTPATRMESIRRSLRYLKACARYAWERWKIQKIVDAPGFARMEAHPELCVPFHQWLSERNLECLTPLFEIPITVMGYGYIRCPNCDGDEQTQSKEIAAPYALKYMTLRTFLPMIMKFSPFMKRFPWPKRFTQGYQRLWERVAMDFNVRLNIDIEKIERTDGEVKITFTQAEQLMTGIRRSDPITKTFDYLILTCPLSLDVLDRETGKNQRMLDLSEQEREMFGKILTYSYALAACSIEPKSWPKNWPRILCTVPPTREGWPWAITRQMKNSELTQFYVQLPPDADQEHSRTSAGTTHPAEQGPSISEHIPPGVATFIEQTGMDVMEHEWHTYDRWPYFQHVTVDEMKDKFYTRLDAMQGQLRTFYGGSLLNFELVENVMEYSEHIARRFFAGQQK